MTAKRIAATRMGPPSAEATTQRVTNQEELEKKVLEKCYQHLSNDQLLITQNLTEEELRTISGFSLFTLKPIIVAINKIDVVEANVDRVKHQLSTYDLIPEDWGGSTIFCEISALKKIGIENLLENILAF